jgi:hypothetical protein
MKSLLSRFVVASVAALMFTLALPLSAERPSGDRTPYLQFVAERGDDRGAPDVRVWVNTHSGVYHCPGTRWYGATKEGTYMKQAEAQKKGFRPAYGKVCY